MKPLSLLESLPDNLLDRITSETVISCPSLNLTLLSELGSNIHESAARVLFATLVLEDDARYVTAELKSSTLSILLNPVKYGPLVRSLEIIDPTRFEMPGTPVHLFETEASSNSSFSATSELLPLTGLDLNRILHALPYLETFSWRATTCPPDGICETLSTYNPRLSNFTYLPLGTLLPSSKNGLLRWDGLSLPLLSNLSLTTLRLSRLSHVGARSLSNLLSLLEEESSLESVSIDTNWLDESICQQLGHVCRKAKRLEFASDGTRLTDGCIVTLLSLCEYLEEFRLGDIQGRLSKALWEKVDDFPSHLKRFKISISEATLHHSWAIDHLSSLQFLPLSALTHLSIARISNPFQLHVHEVASLKPIPAEFVQALRAAKSLRHLTCDWWSWMAEELKVPMENCPDLQVK
ncbi:hypothetical protein M408DRAFT_175571 [Serendipita vermifera MAFF 305830]|uniref:F-box domain-containing protein n=1 Tax=Serendipita vermifera MAFF 305830 TaxID=933852 RepID=A0A0C3B654_SERVB|nr:hypothetical protein M408DRAFT_175571 [Serendipita vermifera MAFF 305830]